MEEEPWDRKLSNGMNVTENKLFEAMKKIGLNPEPQYPISQMHVDFAFPEERLAIEVYGQHHNQEPYKTQGIKRNSVLRNDGWIVKVFSAKKVHWFPDQVANEIAELLGYEKQERVSYRRNLQNVLEASYRVEMQKASDRHKKHKEKKKVKNLPLYVMSRFVFWIFLIIGFCLLFTNMLLGLFTGVVGIIFARIMKVVSGVK